ncbi:MAG: phytanoyl-CoA dioxygenase family protein [Novosphingobium sp.]|nr:phytanoyl-CoA dioxygenase family protein [Novosphingobium sp.]
MTDKPIAVILEEVARQGFSIIPGLLAGTRLARVRRAFDAAIKEMERRGLVVFDPRLDPNDRNIRVNNLPDMDPVFMELLRDPTAIAIARAILGQTMFVSNFTANMTLPGSASMKLHSDQALCAPAPWNEPWLLNFIWCLDRVTYDNGGTLYLPGSHQFRTREDVPADYAAGLQVLEAPAGSAIVLEGRVWHTSGANTTRNERRALLFALYNRDFLRPQVNWEVLLSDRTKAQLNEEDRALLGMGALCNIHGVDLVMREGYDLGSAVVM